MTSQKFKFIKLWDIEREKDEKAPLPKISFVSENWQGDISTFMIL